MVYKKTRNNKYRIVTGYKINTQKSVAFLYAKTVEEKREMNTFPFTVTPKRTGNKLMKMVKELYNNRKP